MRKLWLGFAVGGFLSAWSFGQTDMPLYTDALQNGWQDWSWCTRDLNSTDYVNSGARSTKITMGAWQGFYLSRGAMSTASYDSLRFYIHGGTVNGRNLRIQPIVGGNPNGTLLNLNTFVAGGSIAANQWRLVTIPLSAMGVASIANFTGFWIQEYSGTTQPAFYVDDILLKASAPPSIVNLTANFGQTLATLDARMFSVNAACWDNQFGTATTRTLLSAAGNRALRFPGGSLSDDYHWATNTTGSNTWTWATSFDTFASVARDTGAQVFITANYGSGTPQEAAAWVQYSNITRGHGFKYWEIGNENYGTWENDIHPRPNDPYTYALESKLYIQQMKAVDPTIKIGVVTPLGEDSYANYTDHPVVNPRTMQTHNGWGPVMLTNLRLQGVTPDFLIYHKYHQEPGGENDAFLLQSSSSWASDVASLRQMLTDYLGPAGASVEIVCTENNSVSYNPGKQTTSLVNGLFYADSVGQAAKTELKALMWWDMRNGTDTANNLSPSLYGWRQYGDYGMVSTSSEPYPAYYALKLLQQFGRGGEQVVATNSDYTLLSIYATRRSNGQIALMVINKSPTLTLPASFVLSGVTGAINPVGTLYRYGIPQDEAARTGVGNRDVSKALIKNVGRTFSHSFPPYSMSVIVLTTKGQVPPP
ncbi:MAG: hypothetical protein K1X67_23210 [Fimbriimonadaceae bacterium]|nr:hypothetical protein [Fimbriimonadaceae bacterium]